MGDLTDAQLMERFTTLDRDAAEQAFAALLSGTVRWFCECVGIF